MSRLFCICFFGTKIYPIFARMSKNENIINKVLIIDDEPQIRQLLARILGLEGYEVLQAGDCKAAVKQMEYSPNVVLCDVFLPDGNGVDFIKTIKKISPESEIILLTAHGNIPDGVQAIKNGAFDYITKGDDNNKIIPVVSIFSRIPCITNDALCVYMSSFNKDITSHEKSAIKSIIIRLYLCYSCFCICSIW